MQTKDSFDGLNYASGIIRIFELRRSIDIVTDSSSADRMFESGHVSRNQLRFTARTF